MAFVGGTAARDAAHLRFNCTSYRQLGVAAALFGACAAPSLAAAQAVTPPTRDELAPPQARQASAPTTTLTIDGSLERTPCALDNPDYAAIKVTLNEVRFTGAEKAPEIAFGPTYQQYLGRELPVAVLCDIRAAANRALQDAGYLATVEIPPQRLTGGSAELRIVFGRLTALRVRGEAGPSEQLVAGYLERLTEDEVFNARRAERYLLLADDLPGLDVRLSLRPASNGEPGDLTGEIAVVRRRGALDFNVQNLGSKAVGRFGALLRGEIYDLTGLGDRTGLTAYTTLDFKEQQTLQLSHDFALGKDGLRLGGQVTYSWTDPTLNLPGFDIESETLFATFNAVYPLKRTRSETYLGSLGFDYIDQDLTLNDFRINRDRVRVAFARFDAAYVDGPSIAGVDGYSQYEPRLRAYGSVELRHGLDVFGTSADCRPNVFACAVNGALPTRVEADPTPFLVRFDGRAEFRPTPTWSLALEVDGQYTRDALPAFEEFSAGNYSIGRGYDPGTLLGDSGYALRAEAAYGSRFDQDGKGFGWQPYVFTDVAWAWNRDPSLRGTNPDHLWSAGGGVRAAWNSAVQADVAVAVPLKTPNFATDKGDVRILFSLTTRLLPWRF